MDICDCFTKTSYILKEANGVESRPTHTPESTRNIISPESEPQKIGLPKKINKVNIRRGEKGTHKNELRKLRNEVAKEKKVLKREVKFRK